MPSNALRVAVWYNLPAGGARRALSYQIRGLLKQGHSVECWSAPTKDPDLHTIPAEVKQHFLPLDDRHSPDTYRPPAAKTPWGRVQDFARYYETWLNQLDEFAKHCADEINRGGFDILFATNCWRTHSPFIGRHVDLPKVLYLQEPKRNLYEAFSGSIWLPYSVQARSKGQEPNWRGALKEFFDARGRRLQIYAEVENARAFDRILVNSYFSRESVLRAYGLNATTCYLGVDTELFKPTSREKEPWVVSVGHVGKIKNTAFLIEAIGRIQGAKPTLVLPTHWIDQEYKKICDDLAASLGVKVDYRSGASDEELVDTLSCSSVFGFAAYLEPFGYGPLEANACGTAAVAVAEGGPRETIREGVSGYLVGSDPDEMAERIARLVQDRDFARQMGDQGRRYVEEEWNLQLAEARLEKQLLAVVNTHRP